MLFFFACLRSSSPHIKSNTDLENVFIEGKSSSFTEQQRTKIESNFIHETGREWEWKARKKMRVERKVSCNFNRILVEVVSMIKMIVVNEVKKIAKETFYLFN